MDVNIVSEMVTASCHLTSLGQFYINRSANLASDCFVEILALPGDSQEVFCPLHGGSLRISHLLDDICKLSFMLTLKTLCWCQIWRITWMVHKHDALLLNLGLQ
jgi:hypothetical protein